MVRFETTHRVQVSVVVNEMGEEERKGGEDSFTKMISSVTDSPSGGESCCFLVYSLLVMA